MLSNRSTISAISAAGLALAWSWSAAAADMGTYTLAGADADGTASIGSFYASGDAGVAILQNTTTHDGGGVSQYNLGPKVDVSVGYKITPNIAVELQGGFAHNDLYRINGQPLPPGISIDIWTVPVMANGIYSHSFNYHWQAYGGLGAGAVITQREASGFPDNATQTSPPDCEFGYQAILGIKYRFNDHLECGLGYTFLGSLDQHGTVTVKNVPLPGDDFTVSTTLSPTYMHSILLSLTYKF
jgi:opacity protein-like surface antigen